MVWVGGMEEQKALPRWRSHKVVEGFKIARIGLDIAPGYGYTLHGYDVTTKTEMQVFVAVGYCQQHKPKVGGYYVRYEDGYESFSPAAAFEGCYTPVVVGHHPDMAAPVANGASYDRNIRLGGDLLHDLAR